MKQSVIIHLLVAIVVGQIKNVQSAVSVGAEHGCSADVINDALATAQDKGLLAITPDGAIVLSEGAQHFAEELVEVLKDGVPAPIAVMLAESDNEVVAETLSTVDGDSDSSGSLDR